jgi:hypothetical protein
MGQTESDIVPPAFTALSITSLKNDSWFLLKSITFDSERTDDGEECLLPLSPAKELSLSASSDTVVPSSSSSSSSFPSSAPRGVPCDARPLNKEEEVYDENCIRRKESTHQQKKPY